MLTDSKSPLGFITNPRVKAPCGSGPRTYKEDLDHDLELLLGSTTADQPPAQAQNAPNVPITSRYRRKCKVYLWGAAMLLMADLMARWVTLTSEIQNSKVHPIGSRHHGAQGRGSYGSFCYVVSCNHCFTE